MGGSKLVRLDDPWFPAADEVAVTCKFNGKYDVDVRDFGCSGEYWVASTSDGAASASPDGTFSRTGNRSTSSGANLG